MTSSPVARSHRPRLALRAPSGAPTTRFRARGLVARDPKVGLLRSVPSLANLPDRELAWLGALFDEVRVGPGTVLVREGGRGRDLLLILDGRAVASARGERQTVVGSGDFVGEIALLGDAPHDTTVTTETPTRLLVAGPASVGAILGHPDILRHLARTLADRLRVPEPTARRSRSNVVALSRPVSAGTR